MNNLTTRKIVLGLLVALVLAFSVQGIADALTLNHVSNGGDLQTVNLGQTFTIRFSVRPVGGSSLKPDYARIPSNLITDTNRDTPYYDENDATAGYQENEDTEVSTAVAHYHNDEAIAIEISGDITIKKGSTTLTSAGDNTVTERTTDAGRLEPSASTFTLHEAASDNNLRFSSATITLSCTAPTTGASKATITVRDVTPADDFRDGEPSSRSVITFTIFVVDPLDTTTITAATSIDITDTGTDGFEFRGDGSYLVLTGTNDDVPVTYTVTGGGRVFVQEGTGATARRGTDQTTLTTSRAASVYLDLKRKTSKVTVSHRHLSDSLIYIYGLPQITITGGNNQEGTSGGGLNKLSKLE